MAGNMRDIKRRIRSVSSTKQITRAMELVSTAKLKKSRNRLEKTTPYFDTIVNSIQGILATTSGIRHPFLEKREVKKSAYIVITADKGLAGGYNGNVLRLTEKLITDKSKAMVITIGSKGRDYFKRRDYEVKGEFTGISESPEFSDARGIGDMVMKLYKDKEIDEVHLIYTHFKSTIAYEPEVIKLLPAENIKGDTNKEARAALVQYEPSPEEVLGYLIPKYIHGTLYGALIESSASEQGSRRVAMESATDNATEMIDSLKLKYNRARQAAITQEISEIAGGAEALK